MSTNRFASLGKWPQKARSGETATNRELNRAGQEGGPFLIGSILNLDWVYRAQHPNLGGRLGSASGMAPKHCVGFPRDVGLQTIYFSSFQIEVTARNKLPLTREKNFELT